jgi:integrase
MGRPPLTVGTFGKIDFLTIKPGHVRARARYRDFDGVVRPITRFGSSRPRAEAALKKALRDRTGPSGGQIDSECRVTKLAQLWLDEVGARDLAPATKELYADVVDRQVDPGLGRLRIKEITVPVTDRFIKLTVERSGAGMAKTVRTVLSGMLGLAVRHGALTHNPIRDVARITRPHRPVRALAREEVAQLRAALRTDDAARVLDIPDLVDFILGTGLRIGEACAVRWSAVDLVAGVLEVNSTVVRTRERGLIVQERPKSAAGWRIIALPDSTIEMLRRRRGARALTSAVVFRSPLGKVRDRSNTTGDLRRAFDRAGFDWVTSHTLRKTVATRLDDAGLSARQIADHLGHARPSLTQDVYLGRKVVASDAARLLNLDT